MSFYLNPGEKEMHHADWTNQLCFRMLVCFMRTVDMLSAKLKLCQLFFWNCSYYLPLDAFFSSVKLFKIYFYAISCFREMLKIYCSPARASDFESMLPTWFCSCHSWHVFVYRASGLCAVHVCNVIVLQNNMCLGIKRLCYVTRPCLFQPEDGAAEPSAALKHKH